MLAKYSVKRASALQAEGRRFESVNAHVKALCLWQPFQYASFENVRDRCPVYSMAAYGSAMCWLGSVCFCYAEALSALSSLALPPLFSFFFPF